jgi:hypothetical protein
MPADKAEFQPVFAELRRILAAYEPKMQVVHDTPDHYYLNTRMTGRNGHPIMFGAVRIGKNYVSYYYMPAYGGMIPGMSPALKKRMQGKACFNFTVVDEALFAELKQVTRKGADIWKKKKMEWLE